MKDQIKKTAIVNAILLGVVLLISFLSWNGHQGDLTAFIGLGCLFIAAINIFVGLILIFAGFMGDNIVTRRYGAAMLLVAGVSLLCSLTFCSMAFANL